MRPPQLVILAAGLGSRYGGMKQLEPLGPGGATLMEYSLYDARRAGFGEAVFVIREDMAEAFAAFAAGRFGTSIPWRTVVQRLTDVPDSVTVPPERVKPWGTAHAVLAAGRVSGPFAVLNADDFYGAASFTALAEFLRAHASDSPPSYAVVGFRLGDTVSQSGGVNRGWCRTDTGGWLQSVEEVSGIESATGGGFAGTGESGPVTLPADALVSMNLWGFTPAVFDTLRRGFVEFFGSGNAARGEYLIPTAIRAALARRECRVRVLDPGSRWFGVTHPADRPAVVEALRQLVGEGRYPERLWQ